MDYHYAPPAAAMPSAGTVAAVTTPSKTSQAPALLAQTDAQHPEMRSADISTMPIAGDRRALSAETA